MITEAQASTIEWYTTGREFKNLKAVHFFRVQMLGDIAIVQVDWELIAREGNQHGWAGFRYLDVVAVDPEGRQNGLSSMRTTIFHDGHVEVTTDAESVLPDNTCWE